MTTMTPQLLESSDHTTDLVADPPYAAPNPELIVKGGFVDAPDLCEVADRLGYPLPGGRIIWYWKNSQDGEYDEPVFGDMKKIADPLGGELDAVYWAWVSLGWVVANEMTNRQVDALVFSLCCRCFMTDKGKFIIRKPPIAAFPEELEKFGPWSVPLLKAAAKLKPHIQAKLPGLD